MTEDIILLKVLLSIGGIAIFIVVILIYKSAKRSRKKTIEDIRKSTELTMQKDRGMIAFLQGSTIVDVDDKTLTIQIRGKSPNDYFTVHISNIQREIKT